MKVMLLPGIQMIQLLPRSILLRLASLAFAFALVMGFSAPATAKTNPEVKRIKKELVAIETLHDKKIATLDRFGARWDELEENESSRIDGLSTFLTSALGTVEQSHVEMSIIQVRESIDAIEKQRDESIEELEKIVIERQNKKLKKAGLSPSMMPSINIKGSLVTYSADWEKTATCESTQRWHIDSRYDGGLQFDPITWIEFGGAEFARYAYEATKLEQIAVAERVLVIQGPGAWPICFTPLPVDAEG